MHYGLRTSLFSLVVASVVLGNHAKLFSQQIPRYTHVQAFKVPGKENSAMKIEEFLHSEQPEFEGAETILELAEALAKHVPCIVDLPEFDLAGMDPEEPIRLPAHKDGVSIGNRLAIILHPRNLTAQIRFGVLMITTVESADSEPEIRVYDVSSFIDGRDGTDQQKLAQDALMNSIQTHIDPDNWIINGGTNCINTLNKGSKLLLLVSAPSTTQRKIVSLLAAIKQVAPDAEDKNSGVAHAALMKRQQ